MAALYLWINAALYVVIAVICLLRPTATAAQVGFGALTRGGLSEFITVYGGMELGLAAFFAVCAWHGDWQKIGVVLAICIYVPIAACRVITLMTTDASHANWMLFSLEATLAVLAVVLGWRMR